jgi:hypothetical protein
MLRASTAHSLYVAQSSHFNGKFRIKQKIFQQPVQGIKRASLNIATPAWAAKIKMKKWIFFSCNSCADGRRWLEYVAASALRTPLAGLMGIETSFCSEAKAEWPPQAGAPLSPRCGMVLRTLSGQPAAPAAPAISRIRASEVDRHNNRNRKYSAA